MTALAPAPAALAADGLPRPLRPAERVAVVLSLLDEGQARALAADWPQARVDEVVSAYEALGTLPRQSVLAVVAQFVSEVRSPHPRVRGGRRMADALAAAIRPAAEEAPGDASEAAEPSVWDHAASLEPDALARLVSGERPAVLAAVVEGLGTVKGAALLSALDEPAAARVVLRLASPAALAPATRDAIAEALQGEAEDGTGAAPPPDPSSTLTALLNRCPVARQDAVLEALGREDTALSARVAAGLLRYGTLPERLPRTAAPILFREADQETLDTALRYGTQADPEATDYLYSNISQRLAEQIKERVAERPLPDEAAGQRAQAALIAALIEWSEEGRIALRAPDDDEAPPG